MEDSVVELAADRAYLAMFDGAISLWQRLSHFSLDCCCWKVGRVSASKHNCYLGVLPWQWILRKHIWNRSSVQCSNIYRRHLSSLRMEEWVNRILCISVSRVQLHHPPNSDIHRGYSDDSSQQIPAIPRRTIGCRVERMDEGHFE